MHRIDTDGTVASAPIPPPEGALVGYFTDGDALTGTPGTVISAAWLNAVQEEISNVILEAGLSLDKATSDQLKEAVLALITANSIAGSVGTTADRVVRTQIDGSVTSSASAAIDGSDNMGGLVSLTVGAAISSKDPSAILDLQSSSKGVLIPRMTQAQRDAIVAPASSLLIFNTESAQFQIYINGAWQSVTPRQQVLFEVNGPYYVGGSVQTGLLYERAKQSRKILGAKLYLTRNGTGGTLQVDVKVSQNGGSSWTSIFANKPSVSGSAGDYASSSNAVISNTGTAYASTDIFRLDVESIPDGVPNDFVLVLESEAL